MAIQLSGSLAITGSLTATSQIVAQTLNVQQVTSSIVYSSGSNIFGNSLANTQIMTGSVSITGSLSVNGSPVVLTNQTSSTMFVQGGNSFGTQALIGTNDTQNLALETNGTVRMTISSSGNVGVGISSPIVRLQASGTIAVGEDTTGWGRFSFDNTTNTTRLQSSKNGSESVGLSFWTQASGGGFAERMIISGSNVGIGTTSPTYILDVFNSTEANLRVKTSSTSGLAGLYIGNGNRDYSIITRNSVSNVLEFRNETANNTVIAISGSNVGIGTTSPDAPLEIYSSNTFNTTTGANAHLIIDYNSATAGGPAIRFTRVGVSDWSAIQADLSGGTRTLKFIQTAGGVASTQMVINANDGNVGIGTTNPGYKFHVQGTDVGGVFDGTSTAGSGFVSSYNSADGNAMQMRSYGSTTGATIFGNSSNKMNAIWSNGDTLYAIGTIGATPLILGTSNTERVRVTSGGNVGIGTTNPTRRLYVTATSGEIARFDGSGFAADSAAEIDVLGPQSNGQLNIGIGGSTFVDSTNNIQNKGFITAGTGLTGLNLRSDAGFVQITAGGVAASNEVARFTAAGNVGIGVTSPGAKLSVNLDNFPSDGGTIARFTGGTTTPTTERFVEIFQSYTGAAFDSPMLVFRSNTNASNNSSYGIIRGTADGAIVLSNVNNTSAGVSAASERMRITSSGNVGIGTTSPGSKLQVIAADGYSSFWSNNTSNYTFISIGRTSSELEFGVAGGSNQFFTGTAAGDVIIKVPPTKGNLFIGATSGAPAMVINQNNNVGIGTITPGAKFQVTGSSTVVNFQGSGSNIFTVDGASGRLFSVDDDLTNSLFSVNTIAGLPVIEAFADNTVRLGRYSAVSGSTMMITGSTVAIGTTAVSTEANLFLGAQGTSEGGQLVLQKGTTQTFATHLDNYNDQFRVLSGTNTGSSAEKFNVNMSTGTVTTYGNILSMKSTGGGTYRQTVVGQTTAASSGVAKKIAYVGFTHSVRVYIWANQSTAHGSSAIADICTLYGFSNGGTTVESNFGNVTDIAVTYNNGGSPAYTIDVSVTYSGTAPTINYVIEGINWDNNIYTL